MQRQLAEMDGGELDWWIAWASLTPDPLERIAEILKTGFAVLAAASGAKIEPADLEPDRRVRKRQKRSDVQEVTPRQLADWALATLPGARRIDVPCPPPATS